MTKEYDAYVREDCEHDAYLDRKAEGIRLGLIEDDERAEDKETYCDVCEAQSVLWNYDERIWYCQRCGKVFE